MDYDFLFILIIVSVITLVGTLVSLGVIMILVRNLALPGQLAAIEQLRKDVVSVGALQSHDVIGQVTKWNQQIAANKRYRQLWWSRLLVSPGWENIHEIQIPQK